MSSFYRPSKTALICIAFLVIYLISYHYPDNAPQFPVKQWAGRPGASKTSTASSRPTATEASSGLLKPATHGDINGAQEVLSHAHRLADADAFLPHFKAVTKMPKVTTEEANATCHWAEMEKANFDKARDWEWTKFNPSEEEVDLRRGQWQEFIDHDLMPYGPYKDRFKGRGIVIVAGNEKTLIRTRVIMRALRKLGSKIPIELHYWDNEMNDQSKKEIIETYPNTYFNDLADSSNIFPTRYVLTGNYQFKTAALLNSRFAEPLLLDSDNIPVIDPEELWDSTIYKEYGTLFWPDITRTRPNNPIWAITNTHCRMGEYEQESGQLLVDKRKFFYHLQLAAWLNNRHGDYYNGILLGDKDMFRFSWHALKTKYGFPPKWLTSVGTLHDERYCGHTFAQHHPDGRIAFMHGGLLKRYSKELLKWYRDNRGGVYQVYKRSKWDEQHEKLEAIQFDFDGNAWLPNRPENMTAAWCLGFRDVEPRPLEEIAPGYQEMFNEIGGYWMLDE